MYLVFFAGDCHYCPADFIFPFFPVLVVGHFSYSSWFEVHTVLLALHLQDREERPWIGRRGPTSEVIQGSLSSVIGMGRVDPCIWDQQGQQGLLGRARVVSPFGDAHSPHTVAGARGWEET